MLHSCNQRHVVLNVKKTQLISVDLLPSINFSFIKIALMCVEYVESTGRVFDAVEYMKMYLCKTNR